MSIPALVAERQRQKLRADKRRAKAKRLKLRQSPKALKAKADRLFSLAVRSIGHCQSGRPDHKGPLQCAHGFSRRYLATRWDRRNAWCLCAGEPRNTIVYVLLIWAVRGYGRAGAIT